jgi:hypothetical protein
VAGSCVHGNEPTGSITFWEILEYLSNWWLLKKDSAPWSYLVRERKRSWPNLRCYSGIYLQELRETTNDPSQDSRFQGRDFNPVPSAYEGVSTWRPRLSVT